MEIFSDVFRIMPGLIATAATAVIIANSLLLLALNRKDKALYNVVKSGMKTSYMIEEM